MTLLLKKTQDQATIFLKPFMRKFNYYQRRGMRRTFHKTPRVTITPFLYFCRYQRWKQIPNVAKRKILVTEINMKGL